MNNKIKICLLFVFTSGRGRPDLQEQLYLCGARKIELENWKSQFATSNFPTTILSFVVAPSVGTYWLLCLVGIEPLNNFCSNNSSTFCLESKIAIM